MVGSEVLAPKVPGGIAVWRNTIRNWRPPHQDGKIEEVKRATIIENIDRAVCFAGGDTKVIG